MRHDVPRELSLAWQQRRYGVLPEAGGLLDQEAGLLNRMALHADAYDAWAEYTSLVAGSGAEWQRRNPHKWRLVLEIMRLRNGA